MKRVHVGSCRRCDDLLGSEGRGQQLCLTVLVVPAFKLVIDHVAKVRSVRSVALEHMKCWLTECQVMVVMPNGQTSVV